MSWQRDEQEDNCLLKSDARGVLKPVALMVLFKSCFPKDISVMSTQLTYLKLCKLYQLIFTWTKWPFQMIVAVLFALECIFCRYASHAVCLLTHLLSVTCAHLVHLNIPKSKNSQLSANAMWCVFGRKTIFLLPEFCDSRGGLTGLLCQNPVFCVDRTNVSFEQGAYLL